MEDIFSDRVSVTPKKIINGELIFEVGRSANHILFLESGLVKLERITQEGKEVITSIAREGAYIALAALFSKNYRCTAVALSDCSIRVYPKEAVLSVMGKDETLSIKLIEILAKQIHELREQVEILNVKSAEERILKFIRTRSHNGIFKIPKNLKILSSQLGLTQETMYRKLKELEDIRIIDREPDHIRLIEK